VMFWKKKPKRWAGKYRVIRRLTDLHDFVFVVQQRVFFWRWENMTHPDAWQDTQAKAEAVATAFYDNDTAKSAVVAE